MDRSPPMPLIHRRQK